LAGSKPSSSIPSHINTSGKTASEPTAILELFASHFFPQPSAHNSLRSVPICQLPPPPSEFPPISSAELSNALATLSPAASPGPDGISAGLLCLSAEIISPFILSILNNALQCSYFPAQWRHAKVKIIPKANKENYSQLNSYRPISIVSTLSKVFEKILLSRLSWLAKSLNWFNDRQHGFRESKSTESAAHHLVSFIEDGFSKGHFTAAAFIDIQSAFDKASHNSILAALQKKGCPKYLVSIIACFLRQRKATLFNESVSVTVDLHTGCPQGSVLSAFLWLVLVDDVLDLSFNFPSLSLAYADDVTLVASHRDAAVATAHLQVICDKTISWAKSVELSINASKTTFILFSRRRAAPASTTLQLDGHIIHPSLETVYLGFVLDHRLSWNAHIQSKCIAAKKMIFMVKRCLSATWGLSASRLKKLYASSIEPTLLYGCSLWCPVIDRARSISLLRSTQRLMALVILRSFKSTSTEACFALCGLLPVEFRIAELAACRLLAIGSPVSPRAALTIRNKFPNADLTQPYSIPTRFFSSLFPPWLLPAIQPLTFLPADSFIPLLPYAAGTIRVYTDGSVISGCTGYGLLVVDSSGIVASCRGKLPNVCSIFQAEGQAILQAIRFATSMVPKPSHVEIFSDSRAALLSSVSSDRVTSPFHDVRTLLLTHRKQVQLFWIAGHRGHQGNEIADLLAKQGALGPGTFTDLLLPPSSSFRLKVRQSNRLTWATQWTEITKAPVTRAFFPTIASTKTITNRELPYQVVQLLTGHCRLRSYLFKTACAPSPICSCGTSDETIEHFIFFCQQFITVRATFKETSLRTCYMWPPSLADIARHKPLLTSFIDFVLESKRLDRLLSS
jgi:ribonuclease HI